MSYLDELCKYISLSSIKTSYIDSHHIQEEIADNVIDAQSSEKNQRKFSSSIENNSEKNIVKKNSKVDRRDTNSITSADINDNNYRVNASVEFRENIEIKKSTELTGAVNKTINNNNNEQIQIHNSHTDEIDKHTENNLHEFNKNQKTSINKYSINHDDVNETTLIYDDNDKSSISFDSECPVNAPEFKKINRTDLNVKEISVNENTTSLTEIYNDYVKSNQSTNNKIINKNESDIPQVKIGQINVIVNDRSLPKTKTNIQTESTLKNNDFGLRGL